MYDINDELKGYKALMKTWDQVLKPINYWTEFK